MILGTLLSSRRCARAATGLFLAISACRLPSPALLEAQAPGPSTGSRIVETSPRFEFHSGFWLNLHHFLHARALARSGDPESARESLAGASADTAGEGSLPSAEREDWEGTLEHYERHLAQRDLLFDDELIDLKARLLALGERPPSSDAEIERELAPALEGAAPAYRRLWWPGHDGANRRWVAQLLPLLAQHEKPLTSELARRMGTVWPAGPVRVDVSAYANWAGAYTTLSPTHVVISSTAPGNDGSLALETLFHEAGHALVERVDRSLRRAAEAAEAPPPKGLWHSVLFYTAGELIRERIPEHVPYAEAYGLWQRRDRPRQLVALRESWQPWLEGAIDFEEAIRRLVASTS